MKKLIIGLLFLGLTNLSFSQNSNSGIAEVELEGVVVTAPNYAYLNKVIDKDTPEKVLQLELKAAKFNVKDAPEYHKSYSEYKVVFQQSDGHIIAIYNKSGDIISSSEKFTNIKLPAKLLSSIVNDNPGWKLHSDTYLVSYRHGNNAKKTFKIQLRKGDLKRNLKFKMDNKNLYVVNDPF